MYSYYPIESNQKYVVMRNLLLVRHEFKLQQFQRYRSVIKSSYTVKCSSNYDIYQFFQYPSIIIQIVRKTCNFPWLLSDRLIGSFYSSIISSWNILRFSLIISIVSFRFVAYFENKSCCLPFQIRVLFPCNTASIVT